MRLFCSNISGLRLARWALLSLMLLAASSQAQTSPFTRLQVLLPGEIAAPGTPAGKTGAPVTQTVGVPFSVGIRACDDDWNTVATVSDFMEWSTTDPTSDPPTICQLNAGQLTVTATFNSAGIFTISGRDLSNPSIVEASSAEILTVILDGFRFSGIARDDHTAGEPIHIEITAVDPIGRTAYGFSGPVNLQQLTSYGVGRLSPATVTLNRGTWSGEIVLYRADETNINSGNVHIYACLPDDITVNGASNSFLLHPGELRRVQIVLPGQSPLPGSVSGVTGTPATQGATQPFAVDVYATDNFWNPLVCNDMVLIQSSDLPAQITPILTLEGGTAQAVVQMITLGPQTMTVRNLSTNNITPMTSAPLMVIPAFADHFEFDDLPAAILAGAEHLVTIRATDIDGSVVTEFSGDTMLSASTGPGTISPESVSFTEGIWVGIMQFYGAGNAVQVTCSDYSTPAHHGISTATRILPGPYIATQVILPNQVANGGSNSGVDGLPPDLEAGQEFSINIRAVDQYFNKVSGINNPVTINSQDPNIDLPDEVSLVNGEVYVPVTIYIADYQTLSATDAAIQDIEALSSSNFTVLPGPFTELLLIAPGEILQPGSENGRTGSATDQSITYSFDLTALATDQWYNRVWEVDDVVHLTCTDPDAELPADTAMVDGEAFLAVRLATGGWQQFTVSVPVDRTIDPNSTQLRAVSTGLHFEAEIVEAEAQAGEPFTLEVRVVNNAGSLIQEFNTDVQVIVYNANTVVAGCGVLTPTSFQLLQGQRSISMTYTCAEPIILQISDSTGSTPGLTGMLDVRSGTPDTIILTSEPSWVRANSSAVVSALVTDSFGNPVADQPVTFSSASGDAGWMSSPADKANDTALVSLTDSQGIARMEYHSPHHAQVAQVIASTGLLSTDYDLQTALVDPYAAGGQITNYPNPFHPDETATTIAYVLDTDSSVHMRVYTVSGGLVLDRQYTAGEAGGSTGLNEIEWDGRNGGGEPVASGGYIIYVEADGAGSTQHVMRRKIGVVW